jgi:hypothetical protein
MRVTVPVHGVALEASQNVPVGQREENHRGCYLPIVGGTVAGPASTAGLPQ